MRKIITILLSFLAPLSVFGAVGDITVNNQSTYDVPPGTTKLLILDLTLPENLTSIKLLNLGTAQQWDISEVYIFEDGPSSGFDGDENEIARKASPVWDDEISADSTNHRIFVMVDVISTTGSGKTIKPQAIINSDKTIIGLERTVSAGASIPDVPLSPLALSGEALSTSTIRWKFLDSSNNEFGFRIKDDSLKTKLEVQQQDLSYIDETGLFPNTCYFGRRVSAFNDRGEGQISANFAEVCTLKEIPPASVIEPIPTPPVIEETPAAPVKKPVSVMTADEVRAKITEIMAQIAALQRQLVGSATEKVAGCAITSFSRNLKQGMSGDDIKCLQIILNSSGDTKVTTVGQETTYFGSLTKAAVIKFQEKYASEILTPLGLIKGTGFVASATRAKLNGLLGK